MDLGQHQLVCLRPDLVLFLHFGGTSAIWRNGTIGIAREGRACPAFAFFAPRSRLNPRSRRRRRPGISADLTSTQGRREAAFFVCDGRAPERKRMSKLL